MRPRLLGSLVLSLLVLAGCATSAQNQLLQEGELATLREVMQQNVDVGAAAISAHHEAWVRENTAPPKADGAPPTTPDSAPSLRDSLAATNSHHIAEVAQQYGEEQESILQAVVVDPTRQVHNTIVLNTKAAQARVAGDNVVFDKHLEHVERVVGIIDQGADAFVRTATGVELLDQVGHHGPSTNIQLQQQQETTAEGGAGGAGGAGGTATATGGNAQGGNASAQGGNSSSTSRSRSRSGAAAGAAAGVINNPPMMPGPDNARRGRN